MSAPRVLSRRPLIGIDGNAFSVIAHVSAGLKEAGATREEVDAFRVEAMGGDYDQVLRAALEWTSSSSEEDGG